MYKELIRRISALLSIKSIVTIAMTVGMLCLLSGAWNPQQEVLALYCTSYGAIITFFFTKRDEGGK